MHFLECYYNQIIKYDFINKFIYLDINKIPKLKKIILNFNCDNLIIKNFVTALLTLEIISSKKAHATKAKTFNVFLKIQKGQLTGCKIILRKKDMYQFFAKFLTDVIPNSRLFFKLKVSTPIVNSFSFVLSNNHLFFSEINNHFNLINRVSNLNITIVSTAKTQKELFFLLKSLKLPIKISNFL